MLGLLPREHGLPHPARAWLKLVSVRKSAKRTPTPKCQLAMPRPPLGERATSLSKLVVAPRFRGGAVSEMMGDRAEYPRYWADVIQVKTAKSPSDVSHSSLN